MNESTTSLSNATGKRIADFHYVLVTGGRDFKSDGVVETAMKAIVADKKNVIFINGAQRGADSMCSVFSLRNAWPCYMYPARWADFRKAAGPIRNRLMLDMHPQIEVVLAFHDFLPHSSGTYDMCQQALKRGIPVLHYTDDGLFAVFTRPEDLPQQLKKEGK